MQITSSTGPKFASGAVSSTQQASGSANSGNAQLNIKSATQTSVVSTRNIANIVASEFNRVMNSTLTGNVGTRGAVSTKAISVYSSVSCTNFTTPASVGATDSYAITLNTAGANFAVGDSFTISYYNCNVGGSGVIFAGSTTYTVNSYTAGTSASYTTTFNNFSVTDGVNTLGMSGDMTIAASLAGTKATSNISGNSFTVSLNTDSFTMNKYSETYTLDSVSKNYTYSITMSLVLTGVGTVDITTPTTFAGTGTGEPTAGKMKIAGTNGTYVTISAYNTTQAEVVVYDGSSTSTSHPLWSSL